MSDPERDEFGFYKPRDPFIGTTKITSEDIVQDFRSPPNALLPTEEMIEAGLALTRDNYPSDAEWFAAIYSAMRALAPKVDEGVVEALDNLRFSARRVSNKYGRVGDTDEYSDWTEWVNVREHCDAADAAIAALVSKDGE